jgi:hypothetical protein
MYHQARKLFWIHPMELLGDMGYVESHFGPLEDGVSVSVRCTVFVKHSIGSKIILDTPDRTLGDEAQMEADFGLCWR